MVSERGGMMAGTKQVLLKTIVLAASEIKHNLEQSMDVEDVKANAEALLKIAEAYKKVKWR